MTIMTRFIQLCKADVHGVMDEMEDKGLLLKQHIRDMETSLNQKKAHLAQMAASRTRAEKEVETRRADLDRMEADVAAAIDKERDDIARLLIRRIQRLRHYQMEMKRHLEVLSLDTGRLQESIGQQEHALESIKLQAASYFHQRELKKENTGVPFSYPSSVGPEPTEEEVELELLRRKDDRKGGGA